MKSYTLNSNYKQISLEFKHNFTPNTRYELTIPSSIADCSGNKISESTPLPFTTPKAPPSPPVIPDTARVYIIEIFADPSPEIGLPLTEFVEIYNPGKDTVNLKNWTLSDPTTKATIGNSIILPKEFIILCPAADTTAYKPFGKVIGLSPWPSLNNASDILTLKSHKSRLVDSVAYSDTWYKDPVAKLGGRTLERISLKTDCPGFYNWSASSAVEGGTPGKTNSISRQGENAGLKITDLKITSDSTLLVNLNITPDTAYLKPHYFLVDQMIGRAKKAKFSSSDFTSITIGFGIKFLEGETYLLTADSLKTCNGLVIASPHNIASFTIPSIPVKDYPIVINEIFPDPSPVIGLPEAEFIELYNPTEKPVSLEGLIYEDASNTQFKFKSGEIDAKGYLILCAQKDTLSFKPFGKTLGINPWPSLNNDKDILILRNNKGVEIYRVSYNSNWYKDKEKQQGGYSLEMMNPDAACVGIQNWAASNDASGGTPGKVNSLFNNQIPVQPLSLLDAELTDSVTITLTFNRSVDSLSASLSNHFSTNNGLGNPLSSIPMGPSFEKIQLKYPAIARGKTYKLTAINVTDCSGSLIAAGKNSTEFTYAHKIGEGDILINEILFNPRPKGVDFVEIYNNSPNTLDLKELSIGTMKENSITSERPVSLKQHLFEPNEYVVLTTDPENIKSEYITKNPGSFLKTETLPAFNDDKGVVVLLANNERIDMLSYSEKMHFPLIKDPEGVSLERSSSKRATNEPGNFRSAAASAGYATPGYKNSQHAEEIESKEEVSLASKTFSPDNDGFEDVFILNYRFQESGLVANAWIYNDQGILIRKPVKNQTLSAEGSIIWDGLNELNEKVPVGIYLIYLEVFDLKGNVKKYRKNFVLASKLNQ